MLNKGSEIVGKCIYNFHEVLLLCQQTLYACTASVINVNFLVRVKWIEVWLRYLSALKLKLEIALLCLVFGCGCRLAD